MTRAKLNEIIMYNTEHFDHAAKIKTAVDAYTSALLKQCNVSGALPLTENEYLKNKVKELLMFVESDGWIVNGFRTLEIVQELKKLCGNDH